MRLVIKPQEHLVTGRATGNDLEASRQRMSEAWELAQKFVTEEQPVCVIGLPPHAVRFTTAMPALAELGNGTS